ncbi:MAG TPA: hypothetical protein VFS94_10245 [Gemmatimonadales bacterium]|nr:hypothetical protein [Gemmatimonadales bacterium]
MTATIRVFVNEKPVTVPAGARVRDALTAAGLAGDPGAMQVTDARGLPVAPDAELGPGTILRAFSSARRVPDDHA